MFKQVKVTTKVTSISDMVVTFPAFNHYEYVIIKKPQYPNRTPFEQAAYDEQFRTRNRVSGPELTSTLTPNINETRSDYDLLVVGICFVAFIILIICVSNNSYW